MTCAFYKCEYLKHIKGLENIKSVLHINYCFYDCRNLESLDGINDWIINDPCMTEVFTNCESLQHLNLTFWNLKLF